MTIARPVDIARSLNISTSSLRHYEDWGMIPPVERTAAGYRVYTDEHVAYFECIRAMADGFGIWLTANVLRHIRNRDIHTAFDLVGEAQASLYNDKKSAAKTLDELINDSGLETGIEHFTIQEISRKTAVPVTTIRHWEKEGLLTVPRNNQNGYRTFHTSHIQQVRVIRALKTTVYSQTYSLEGIKGLIQKLETNNREAINTINLDFQKHLSRISRCQMRGVHSLICLCEKIRLELETN